MLSPGPSVVCIPDIHEVCGFSHLAGNRITLPEERDSQEYTNGDYPIEVHFRFGGFVYEYGLEKEPSCSVLLMTHLRGLMPKILKKEHPHKKNFIISDYNPKREKIHLPDQALQQIQSVTSGCVEMIMGKIAYTKLIAEIFLGTDMDNLKFIHKCK